jgi:hypothetical protein
MQCGVTLFIEENVVVHLSGVIRGVLTQEVENRCSTVGLVEKVNYSDLARIRQWCTEVRKLLGRDPGIKPSAVGLKSHRPVNYGGWEINDRTQRT